MPHSLHVQVHVMNRVGKILSVEIDSNPVHLMDRHWKGRSRGMRDENRRGRPAQQSRLQTGDGGLQRTIRPRRQIRGRGPVAFFREQLHEHEHAKHDQPGRAVAASSTKMNSDEGEERSVFHRG